MDAIKTLLVDVPQDLSDMSEDHSAVLTECLQAASELAQCYNSRVVLFSHVYAAGAALDTWLQGTVLHNTRDNLVQNQLSVLELYADKLREKGFKVETKAVWGKNLDDALHDAFAENELDLVVQPSRHHLFAASVVRQPNEWRMIRFPGVPVILQQTTSSLTGKVLLALDVGEVEISENGNKNIIQQMQKWCMKTKSELHLINAYPSAADLMAFAPADWTIPQIQNTLQTQHKERLLALAASSGIGAQCVHVAEGPVALVIEEQAELLNADLVAMTSHCRRGVSGFFVGNTAEVVLEHTKLNLLVLKPLQE